MVAHKGHWRVSQRTTKKGTFVSLLLSIVISLSKQINQVHFRKKKCVVYYVSCLKRQRNRWTWIQYEYFITVFALLQNRNKLWS